MEQVTCHGCKEKVGRNQCASHSVWEGVISARRVSRLFCLSCLSDLRQEQEERKSWEYEGENWKEGFDPDTPEGEGETWKDDE